MSSIFKRPSLSAAIAIGLLLPLAAFSVHPICDFFYNCGCEPVWAGGVEHCNIHRPEPPHCPWCAGPFHLYAAIMLTPALLAIGLGFRRRWPLWKMVAGSCLGYAAGVGAAGWLGAWNTV